jgi:hypothetical protein
MRLEETAALIALATSGPFTENTYEHLQALELVRKSSDANWEITERGRVFIDHLQGLELPRQITQWVMPSDDPPFSLAAFGSAAQFKPMNLSIDDGPPPPPPIRRKREIPTDPDELKAEADRLMNAGYGMNEVKAELELTDAQAQAFFFGH